MTIDDWPNPIEPESSDAGDESDAESADGDHNPEYMEREVPLGLNGEDEPEIDHNELRAFLEAHLDYMNDDEWEDLCRLLLIYLTRPFTNLIIEILVICCRQISKP